jgi:prepilin-type N-terminal cleavage/methylation domain-containing protein
MSRLQYARSQPAFTLVELLVAMAIIAILAAMLLGVAARAGEAARSARTKQMIARLHTLVMERYESYRSRRVELPETNPPVSNFSVSGQLIAAQRLHVLRTIMQMEMPDRWSDILNARVADFTPNDATNNPGNLPPYRLTAPNQANPNNQSPVIPRTPLCSTYLRQYAKLTADPSTSAGERAIVRNQGAECLYLIVMFGTADGEARGLFKGADIGDTDEDGALEILDGWGRPISFVRWPKGFTDVSEIQTSDSLKDPDPFDPFRVQDDTTLPPTDPTSHRMTPLVVSAGPDEQLGLATEAPANANPSEFRYPLVPLGFPRATPPNVRQYVLNAVGAIVPHPSDPKRGLYMGENRDSDELGRPNNKVTREQHVDNIHNHQISAR